MFLWIATVCQPSQKYNKKLPSALSEGFFFLKPNVINFGLYFSIRNTTTWLPQ